MSKAISATEFQRNIGAVVNMAVQGEAVIVVSHGRPQVAIISAAEYDALIEAQRQWTWTRLARIGDNGAGAPQS